MSTEFTKFADPPGTFIREELEARGWSQRDLAYILGVPEQSVTQIVTGKRGISADMAKALGEAFGVAAEFFANLQRAYNLAQAADPDPGIATRGRVQEHYPLREMIKRGWIEDSDPVMLETQVSRFFEVDEFTQVPHLAHAAKRTHYDEVPSVQLAWLFRVRQIAKTMVVPKYSRKSLEEAVLKMADLRNDPEEVRHVPRLLQESGVRFVLVEGLPGGKIDGVCFWLDSTSPVIGLSLRLDRIDNFWFVLRHEIEHVLRKHGQNVEIIDVDIEASTEGLPDEEVVANEAAINFCVPQQQMNSYYLRKKPFFYERDTVAFARRMGVHPGLVVGQIRKLTENWKYLTRYLVKTRHHIIPAAMVDGWGEVAPVEI